MFPLFETIAITDDVPQNLVQHQKRLNNAMQHYFNCSNSFNLAEIIHVPDEFKQGLVRCRMDYNHEHYDIKFFSYTPRKIERFQCVYTENLDYQFKYSDRKRLDFLKNLQNPNEEIIIVNNGYISDCSIGNLLFLKAGKWFSPQDYLLKGTQLSLLLEEEKVQLTHIKVEELKGYEGVMMINALNPFKNGYILPISIISV